jgi:hypothetical protein
MRYWIYGLLAAMCLAMGAVQVKAHSWYPPECCSGYDCAPVIEVYWVASDPDKLPVMVVRTEVGTAVVPHNVQRRVSPDSRMHACMTAFKQEKDLLCLFLPPSL